MVIGITGGVGCGKSTVLGYIKNKYDAEIILCDELARELMLPGNASYNAVIGFFGNDILSADKSTDEGFLIDNSKLAEIVFSDPEKLKILNSIVHPIVKEEIRKIIDGSKNKIIFIESAIIIEAGYLDLIDELWLVTADISVRKKRLYESRGYSSEKTDSIINNQLSMQEMLGHASYVIDNSGSISDMQAAVDDKMEKILSI